MNVRYTTRYSRLLVSWVSLLPGPSCSILPADSQTTEVSGVCIVYPAREKAKLFFKNLDNAVDFARTRKLYTPEYRALLDNQLVAMSLIPEWREYTNEDVVQAASSGFDSTINYQMVFWIYTKTVSRYGYVMKADLDEVLKRLTAFGLSPESLSYIRAYAKRLSVECTHEQKDVSSDSSAATAIELLAQAFQAISDAQ